MRLTISKSKNSEHLYITKGFRNESGKSTSKTVKKLGTMSELLPRFNNDREAVLRWANEQARILTEQENEGTLSVTVDFTEGIRNELGESKLFNCGYLFPKIIYYKLKLNKIADSISKKSNSEYDLNDILEKLVYSRILYPSSKRATEKFSHSMLEQPKFTLPQIYRALSLLADHSDDIQEELYKNSLDIAERNKGILFYDCTNFFFEIEEEDEGLRKYGKSKEHRPNPIVQMGLFLDGNGIPLAFTVFPGNESEQPSLKPLETKILRDFGMTRFIVCTDAGLASAANRKFNNVQGRSFIVTQSLKKVKEYIKDWALEKDGWKMLGSNDVYNIDNIDAKSHFDDIFYKERWFKEDGLEQRMIVSFCLKYQAYQRKIRNSQIQRAEKMIENGKKGRTKNPNSPQRFINSVATTDDGEIAENETLSLDLEKIQAEEQYDGFYAVCTTLLDDAPKIVAINKKRWQIEDSFRTMKSEFKARPVYLRREDRIKAHFLTCFIALLILRILEQKLPDSFSSDELIRTLRGMNMYALRDIGYLSAYTRTPLTDKLNEVFNIATDNEFTSLKSMKKILKTTKTN